ncbi:MAG: 4Fe-4S dicluster domain-containing protein [Planctomycetota bacterium]|nr:4Fe-4S dicluster domain-containing protein [Planctomycetota bacterium]
MTDVQSKTWWKGPREQTGAASIPQPHTDGPAQLSRRRFLEAAGFVVSTAAVSGCGRAPVETALPFGVHPEGVQPGRMKHYASTCLGCAAGCGLLVGTRDGRPLKMEGIPEHPLSKGGLCAVGQAVPLGLYDSQRLTHPLKGREKAEWSAIDDDVIAALKQAEQDGGVVRVVTGTVNSPTLQHCIDTFLGQFTDGRHVSFDPISSSAILDAHARTHGKRVLPHYKFDEAKVIVSFGADFLGTWISPVEFTAGWRTQRVPDESDAEMSWHVHLEGRMSLTGSKADKRYRLTPNDYGLVLSHLAVRLGELAGRTLNDVPPSAASPIDDADLDHISGQLWKHREACLVLCDSQDVQVQVLVNYLNELLGNYGKTLDIARPSRQRLGNDRELIDLIEDLRAGKVQALLVAGPDLTHNLPNRREMAELVAKVSLVVSLAERVNDFAELAHFVCPDHHPLESWLDAEPISGVVSLCQPTIRPLGNTRSILESFAKWSGRKATAYDIVRATWRDTIMPRQHKTQVFADFWNQSVHDGFVQVDPLPSEAHEFRPAVVKYGDRNASHTGASLELYAKIGMPDSRHSHNPWLQELPDPISKVTWDNYVCMSPKTAARLDATDGDVVRVEVVGGEAIELPAFIQPGQHDDLFSVALGYGSKGTERFADVGPQWFEARTTVGENGLVGTNVASLLAIGNETVGYVRSDVKVTKTGRRHDLATTQEHDHIEVPAAVAPHGAERREVVQETTLSAFRVDPKSGAVELHHDVEHQLWDEDHPKNGHAWGMVIDLNACTGCSACLIACQSENNVAVVGRDEVRRQREMHWIRIDRYYSGEGDDIEVAHQPMMCQHCDNAPCETVCPVLATVHSEEGLNEQAYNRCVGTRYCANNCPTKCGGSTGSNIHTTTYCRIWCSIPT